MYVKVHVYPGMKKERVTETAKDHYELVVKEPAERNAANGRVRELIAELYGVPVGKVRIVTGHRSPSKLLEIIKS
ncbi:MAG TPA: DUF167 domain-containing protein [Candidatus Paceibacterota bacterium]